MKKYPLKLKTVYKSAIWGGHKLSERFELDSGTAHQAEAWQLTVRDDGMNIIENGEYAGMTLGEYLGENTAEFPLLVKYIDAGEKLSIQVHPAKTEMWYIVDAEPNAWLIYGQEGSYTEDTLRRALDEGKLEDILTKVHVKAGECYFIPTGLTHAIGGGILIAEIQENSNVTYRVYDYNRRQDDGTLRELHTDQAFRVMKKFDENEITAMRYSVPCSRTAHVINFSGSTEILASCDKFTVRKYSFTGAVTINKDNHFSHIMCVDGNGEIGDFEIKAGDSYFIPAGSENISVKSRSGITILESFVL